MDGDGSLGLKVKITPEIDKSKLEAEGKKVENQLNKNIKLSGTGEFGKTFEKIMPKSMKSALGSNGSKGLFGSITGGGGGGMGKAAVAGGVAGLAMAGIQGILEILKKMFSLLVDASPQLKAILKMLNQGFMMILRPLGDALAMMLRPIAMFFRSIGRDVMKRMRAKRAELKAEGLSGGALGAALLEEMPTIYLESLFDAVRKIDWGSLFDQYLNFVWTNLTERLPTFISTLLLGIRSLVADGLIGIGGWIWQKMTDISKWGMDVLSGFGGWIFNALTGKIGPMDALTTVAGKIYDIFVEVYNTFARLMNQTFGALGVHIELLKTTAEIEKAAADAAYWANYAKMNTHTSTGAVIQNGHASAYRDSPFPMAASGATVTGDGPVYVHRGEIIKDAGDIRQMIADTVASIGGGGSTIVIPGSAIADAIDRRIDYYYRTRVVNRR